MDMPEAPPIPPPSPSKPIPPSYRVFNSSDDINYRPEDALKEGLGMVKTLKANIKKLELGSKLRKDVWLREIERRVLHCSLIHLNASSDTFCSLQGQGAPTTMVAVCGGTL